MPATKSDNPSPSQRSKKGGTSHRPNSSPAKKAKKKSPPSSPNPGTSPTQEAAALLAEAFARTSVDLPSESSLYDGKTATNIFDEAFDAAKLGDFDAALKVLRGVASKDALLQALLQAQSDTPEGHTILHQAAWHGHVDGVRELLRLGADAARPNLEGHSSLVVAQERGHESVAKMLYAWMEAWSGWDAEELTVLACLYHSASFEGCEAYLRRRIESEAVRANRANLFNKPLPSGITMLEIAEVMDTPGCKLLLEHCGPNASGVMEATVVAAGKEAGQAAATSEEMVDVAAPSPTEGPAAEGPAADGPASGTEAAAAAEEPVDWPEDNWVLRETGFMVCALCKGRSGVKGRFGRLSSLPPTALKHPLKVCTPCQERHGVDQSAAEGEASVETWAEGVVRIMRWRNVAASEEAIATMVHPSLGEIGH